jgi:hypothetical protein
LINFYGEGECLSLALEKGTERQRKSNRVQYRTALYFPSYVHRLIVNSHRYTATLPPPKLSPSLDSQKRKDKLSDIVLGTKPERFGIVPEFALNLVKNLFSWTNRNDLFRWDRFGNELRIVERLWNVCGMFVERRLWNVCGTFVERLFLYCFDTSPAQS